MNVLINGHDYQLYTKNNTPDPNKLYFQKKNYIKSNNDLWGMKQRTKVHEKYKYQ